MTIWSKWWYLISDEYVFGPDLGEFSDIQALDEGEGFNLTARSHAYKITNQEDFELGVRVLRRAGATKVVAVRVTVDENQSEIEEKFPVEN